MSVRYSRIPTEDDMESGYGGLTFDYSSAFSFENDPSRSYKSAFTYSSQFKQQQSGDNLRFETASRNLMDRVCYYVLNALIYALFVITFPISIWFAIKNVPNFERLVVFRWGQLHKTLGPGLVFVMPFVDRCHKVDVRMKAFTVPPQQVITGDGAIIEVGADVYYRIADPERSITNVQNLDKSTRILLQTSLLNILVKLPLSSIEGHCNSIAEEVQNTCNEAAKPWGLVIDRLDISQIKVIQKPPANQPKPSVVMPPGLANLGNLGAVADSLSSGAVPEAFQHLTSAFLAAQGFSCASESQNPKVPNLVKPASVCYDNTAAASVPPSHASLAAAAAGGVGDAFAAPSTSETSAAVPLHTILQAAKGVINESLVRKVNAIYQFELLGDGGRMYYLDLKNGNGSIGEGAWLGEGDVDATLTMKVEDLQRMLLGKLKPFQAYMSGLLRVSGDLASALRLETFIDRLVAQSRGK